MYGLILVMGVSYIMYDTHAIRWILNKCEMED